MARRRDPRDRGDPRDRDESPRGRNGRSPPRRAGGMTRGGPRGKSRGRGRGGGRGPPREPERESRGPPRGRGRNSRRRQREERRNSYDDQYDDYDDEYDEAPRRGRSARKAQRGERESRGEPRSRARAPARGRGRGRGRGMRPERGPDPRSERTGAYGREREDQRNKSRITAEQRASKRRTRDKMVRLRNAEDRGPTESPTRGRGKKKNETDRGVQRRSSSERSPTKGGPKSNKSADNAPTKKKRAKKVDPMKKKKALEKAKESTPTFVVPMGRGLMVYKKKEDKKDIEDQEETKRQAPSQPNYKTAGPKWEKKEDRLKREQEAEQRKVEREQNRRRRMLDSIFRQLTEDGIAEDELAEKVEQRFKSQLLRTAKRNINRRRARGGGAKNGTVTISEEADQRMTAEAKENAGDVMEAMKHGYLANDYDVDMDDHGMKTYKKKAEITESDVEIDEEQAKQIDAMAEKFHSFGSGNS